MNWAYVNGLYLPKEPPEPEFVLFKEQRLWADLGYYCEATVNEHSLYFKVYKVLSTEPELLFCKAGPCSGIPADGLEDAAVFLGGWLKWDGCTDLVFEDEGSLHFCGRKHATGVGALLDRIYDMGDLMPHWDGE